MMQVLLTCKIHRNRLIFTLSKPAFSKNTSWMSALCWYFLWYINCF